MEALASATGIPEPTLRLLTSVLAAYPIALVQRKLLTPTVSPATRNLFNVVSGVGVAFFFCGRDIVHSWITISATWLICRFAQQFLHPKQWWFAQAFSFVFNCAYLLISYYFTASEEYDINWTTPQSVLTLRLIGFAFDFADGAKFKLAAEKKKKEDGDSGTEQPADQPAAIPAPALLPRLPAASKPKRTVRRRPGPVTWPCPRSPRTSKPWALPTTLARSWSARSSHSTCTAGTSRLTCSRRTCPSEPRRASQSTCRSPPCSRQVPVTRFRPLALPLCTLP
ncbi:hypothetical protein BCR44DRAFT_1538643 [Catenaria anguillulae PL171]|uniref:Uncharacterized protein n=1 Tax=Catenaria anguillulae PL171 TaxID=765915 RepID=A0A1Y2HYD3_9FUNG|nr:hypothetical protein BCR44DRAFT_1538643 [Catenaria anguillulae PL171]